MLEQKQRQFRNPQTIPKAWFTRCDKSQGLALRSVRNHEPTAMVRLWCLMLSFHASDDKNTN